MSLAKTLLHRLGLLRLFSQARNGTWRYMRGGYSPRRFWEGWGGTFPDQKYQQGLHAGQEWLRDRLGNFGAGSVLEVGCGFGRNLDILARGARKPGRCYGVDISAKMLLRGRRSLPPDCGLACADLLDLPFRDSSFQVVFTHGVLMHMTPEALPRALAEIRRVAASTILLVEETYWKGMGGGGLVEVNGYTFLHEYRKAIEAAGLGILEASESGGSVNLAFFRCAPR